MTQVLSSTKPDVDLADGRFYADGNARDAYRWMRANEPVFRDRNGLAAAASHQAVLDAERNPNCSPVRVASGPTSRVCRT